MNSRKQTLYLGLVGWLALFLAGSTIAFSQDLAVTGVKPESGEPRDRIRLRGQGFDQPARSYFAWVSDGERGFILDVKRKRSKNQLGTQVGDNYDDVQGNVLLWEGRRLPREPFAIDDGRFRVRDAYVFNPKQAARGPRFAGTPGTGSGASGHLVNGDLVIDLSTLLPGPKGQTSEGDDDDDSDSDSATPPPAGDDDDDGGGSPIGRLPPIYDLTVEGAGESCGEPSGDGGGGGSGDGGNFTANGYAIDFRVVCTDRQACEANPAELVAQGIRGLSVPGLRVATRGTTVVVSFGKPMCRAALNVTASMPPIRGRRP